MRKPLWFLGIGLLATAACSSTSASGTDGGTTTGTDGGGLATGTCETYGATVAKNAPSCGGIPDVAGTFSDACKAVADSLKSCTSQYAALVTCQANGAKCDGGKVALGACDAETAAFSACGTAGVDGGGGGGGGTKCKELAACCAKLPDPAKSNCEDYLTKGEDYCGNVKSNYCSLDPAACTKLDACCATLSGDDKTTCTLQVSTYAGNVETCGSALRTWQGKGECL